MDEQDRPEEERGPSRSQRKRDLEAVAELARQLVELPVASLERIPLDAHLREEVDEGRRLHQRGARKRQLKLIAALLREADHEAIQEAYTALSRPAPGERAELKAIERWRERLLAEGAEGDAALTELVETFPAIDVQRLRQLQRTARRPSSEEKGKKAGREIFQLVAEQLRRT
ncbi:MAG: ribosome biogenesis factor YjgA [Deltaproteobacteria bacterium]|nr:ribosome biogenesis factor YjgA [Deltaproteobacteria bacterium]